MNVFMVRERWECKDDEDDHSSYHVGLWATVEGARVAVMDRHSALGAEDPTMPPLKWGGSGLTATAGEFTWAISSEEVQP